MKSLFTALVAVFFMFAVNGCSDDTECDTVVVDADVSLDAVVSDPETDSDSVAVEDDVVDSDDSAVEDSEATDVNNESSEEAADEGESE